MKNERKLSMFDIISFVPIQSRKVDFLQSNILQVFLILISFIII
jgi:hypothetical protein